MRVALPTYGSRGDVEPVAAIAVRLRELGTKVRVCAPPDEGFAQLLSGVGTPMVPVSDGPTPTYGSLSAALETTLTPETSARAAAVARAIHTNGATVAAKLLLDRS